MSSLAEYTKALRKLCKQSTPLKDEIEEVLCKVESDKLMSSPLIAKCLLSILGSRSSHTSSESYENVVESVEYLVSLDSNALKEVISLTHSNETKKKASNVSKDSRLKKSPQALSPNIQKVSMLLKTHKKQTSFNNSGKFSEISGPDSATRGDRFGSVTSFGGDLAHTVVNRTRVVVSGNFKCFSFTPVYSLLDYLLCSSKDERFDEESRLLEVVLNKNINFNYMMSVKEVSVGKMEESTYWPIWMRLLQKGRLEHLMKLLKSEEEIEVSGRRTTVEFRQNKFYIINSRNALHEICSWSKRKMRKLKVSEKSVLKLAKMLIKRGCDVDGVSMRREVDNKRIKKLVRKYKKDMTYKMKKLPGERVNFFVWQTPLSLAIRAKNVEMVRLLANKDAQMKFGEVLYPRSNGILFDKPIEKVEGFERASDLSLVPLKYSLSDVYHKVIDFELNFIDWKHIFSNETLYQQTFNS